jgi:osmoprotectant transport system ATP-binding protein
MDEPFGAIDPINREVIQDEFMKLQAAFKKTVVFVSHDIDEAVKMATRIAIFRDGRLIQCDSPDRILAHPANEFIAEFVGSDRALKRLRLKKVGAVMIKDCPVAKAEDPLDRAAKLMEERGLGGLAIIDDERRPNGMIKLEMTRGRQGRVADHREALPTTIHVNDDLRTAVSVMFAHAVTWIACVNDQGAVEGCITQSAITDALGAAQKGA